MFEDFKKKILLEHAFANYGTIRINQISWVYKNKETIKKHGIKKSKQISSY